MLAYTHHALVQFAYNRTRDRLGLPHKWFTRYAILGDDVIIGEKATAMEYLAVMAEIGVEISFAKSLISPNRLVGEFAKRFFIPKDASMVPMRESIVAKYDLAALIEFVTKYKLSISQVCGILGFGYRVKGSLNKLFCEMGNKASGMLVAMSSPVGPYPLGLST
jgi:hypothetical protein